MQAIFPTGPSVTEKVKSLIETLVAKVEGGFTCKLMMGH